MVYISLMHGIFYDHAEEKVMKIFYALIFLCNPMVVAMKQVAQQEPAHIIKVSTIKSLLGHQPRLEPGTIIECEKGKGYKVVRDNLPLRNEQGYLALLDSTRTIELVRDHASHCGCVCSECHVNMSAPIRISVDRNPVVTYEEANTKFARTSKITRCGWAMGTATVLSVAAVVAVAVQQIVSAAI